jgi:hypothetical protein
MSRKSGTTITYPEDLKWEPVGSLDENGKGIFVSQIYGDPQTKGPIHFLMKYSAGVTARKVSALSGVRKRLQRTDSRSDLVPKREGGAPGLLCRLR